MVCKLFICLLILISFCQAEFEEYIAQWQEDVDVDLSVPKPSPAMLREKDRAYATDTHLGIIDDLNEREELWYEASIDIGLSSLKNILNFTL
jgi:hypothetical protein